MQRTHDYTPYTEVAQLIEARFLPSSSNGLSQSAQALQQKILTSSVDIDYDIYATEFMERYWLRNFWKAVYFFEHEYHVPSAVKESVFSDEPFRVLVFGAGSAADTLALMTWINKHVPCANVSITLVDRSRRQLTFARRVIETAQPYFTSTTFSVSYVHAELAHWQPKARSADMVLMSHLLTENPDTVSYLLHLSYLALKSSGDVIIIERESDRVWDRARSILSNLGLSVYNIGTKKEPLEELSREGSQTSTTMSPQYVHAKLPEQKYFASLLARYFKSWRHQSVDLVSDVFTDHATYDDKPGVKAPMRGKRAIQHYWVENPLQQTNIQMEIQQVAYGPHQIMCMFGGDFDTPEHHVHIQGAMYFFIDQYTEKFDRLVENYKTKKTVHRY